MRNLRSATLPMAPPMLLNGLQSPNVKTAVDKQDHFEKKNQPLLTPKTEKRKRLKRQGLNCLFWHFAMGCYPSVNKIHTNAFCCWISFSGTFYKCYRDRKANDNWFFVSLSSSYILSRKDRSMKSSVENSDSIELSRNPRIKSEGESHVKLAYATHLTLS